MGVAPRVARSVAGRVAQTVTGDVSAPGASQTPPLPSTAVEYWHGELGASSANAVGQIAGTTLTGLNTPAVAVDTGFFKGRTVYQATNSGSKSWYAAVGAFTANGTRPYIYAIGRWRTAVAPGGTRKMVAINDTGPLARFGLEVLSLGELRGRFNSTASRLGTGSVDTAVHRLELWRDGTNRNYRQDGTLFQAADAGTDGATAEVGIGCLLSGTEVGDASVAFLLVCSAVPSAGEITALNEWATAYWGAP